MSKPPEPKESPNVAALVAAAIGVVALLVWIGSLWMPSPDEVAQADREAPVVEAPAAPNAASAPAAPAPAPAPAPAVALPAPAPAPAPAPPAPVAAAPHVEPRSPRAERRGAETRAAPSARQPQAAESVAPQIPAPQPPPRVANSQAAPAKADGAKSSQGSRGEAPVHGRYVGNLFTNSEMVGLTLVISGFNDGVVTGTATLGGRGCNGAYPMQGRYQSNKLSLRATRNGGPAGDCPLNFALNVLGDTLVGATDSGDKVQLRK
jgi:hypothetical protein